MLTALHSRAPNLSFRKKYQRTRRKLFLMYYELLKKFISISWTIFDISKVGYGQIYFSTVRNLDPFLVFDWSSITTSKRIDGFKINNNNRKWMLYLFLALHTFLLVIFTLFACYCCWAVKVCQSFFALQC